MSLDPATKADLLHYWPFWARPNQIAPDGDWSTWLILAGRGFGKTRAGAEWIRQQQRAGAMRMALVAETAADARDVLVEGPSGILAISSDEERPLYESSKRRVTWPNGATATLYNGTEPNQLRGPEHEAAWVDEIAKYRYPQDTWDMLQFGMRVGNRPRVCVTTTPRPIGLIRELIKLKSTVLVQGSTFDNIDNLPRRFIDTITERYLGTRIGRQELMAEILDDVPGALWTAEMFRRYDGVDVARVVVGVDPSGARSADDAGADSIGIVVAAKLIDGTFAILEDATCKLSPAGWSRRAVEKYHEHKASVIVAERNFGGDMVPAIIRTIDPNANVKTVTASRGKTIRAEPIAALYEQKRVAHNAGLELLEGQMMQMTNGGFVGDASPDRVDAAVWALSELMLEPEAAPFVWNLGGQSFPGEQ